MASVSKQWTQITVNGETYSSVGEMPPDVRAQYERVMGMMADKNNNGIPDILEGGGQNKPTVVVKQVSATTKTVLGKGSDLPMDALKLLTGTQTSDDSRNNEGGQRIVLTWPTLLAIIATVVVVTAFAMWQLLLRR